MKRKLSVIMGTYQINKKQIPNIIKASIYEGALAFDTAPSYGTERIMGKQIQDLIDQGVLKRNNIYVIDKIDAWQMQKYDSNVDKVVDNQLRKMKLDYIDCYLIHWPVMPYFLTVWEKLQKIKIKKKILNIGVCNIDINFLDNILKKNGLPDVIQIERHPYNICSDIVDAAYKYGIYLQAYSPLCRMQFYKQDMDTFEKIGSKYNKTSVQTILRWQLDTGAIPIVKSSKAEHMFSNKDICDFKLTEDDIKLINSMDKEYKFFPLSWGCPGGGIL